MNTGCSENVILVHGLWMHGIVLLAQRHWLAQSEFVAETFSYPSVRRSLDENSLLLARYISGLPGGAVNVVAHSLGGLVVLNMLAQASAPCIKRVVLMGSPCSGSYCASVMLRTPLLTTIVGRSIRDASRRSRWDVPAEVEIGVIAGNHSFGLGRMFRGLPRPNDGVVSVEETRLAGCSDAIVLPVSHSEMLISKECAKQAGHFLKNGRFFHA